MKNIKFMFTLVELVVCIVITTGCFPNVDTDSKISSTNNSQNSTIDFPTHIENNDIDNLKIDADVILPTNFDTNQKVSIASAEYRTWDRESIVSEISNGRQIEDESYGENTGPNDLFYSYTFDDNANLIFSSDGLFYSTEMAVDFQYAYYFDSYENYIYDNTLSEMFSKDKINGIEKSDALSSANKIVSLLNINDVLAEPKIYSLDAATMNELQNASDATDKYGNPLEKWGSEQEAYLVVYPVIYRNIPSLKMNAVSENELISSSNVYFIYGRNGLISFYVSGIFNIKNIEQESPIFSPVNAIENVKNYFNNIIMDSEIDILLIKLVYIKKCDFENIKDLKVEPVWFIYGKYKNTLPDSSDSKDILINDKYITLISAVTGETIPISSIGR